MTFTYTILDVERKEIIGLVESSSQSEAMRIARDVFNSTEWDSRFPFEAVIGRELAIRPHYDPDPYFGDHNAKMIKNIKTYR